MDSIDGPDGLVTGNLPVFPIDGDSTCEAPHAQGDLPVDSAVATDFQGTIATSGTTIPADPERNPSCEPPAAEVETPNPDIEPNLGDGQPPAVMKSESWFGCALPPIASGRSFPPLAKGGPGGVVAAPPVTRPSSAPGSLMSEAPRHPPSPPLRKGGKAIASQMGQCRQSSPPLREGGKGIGSQTSNTSYLVWRRCNRHDHLQPNPCRNLPGNHLQSCSTRWRRAASKRRLSRRLPAAKPRQRPAMRCPARPPRSPPAPRCQEPARSPQAAHLGVRAAWSLAPSGPACVPRILQPC